MTIAIGGRFRTTKAQEVKDARGRRLANYLPDFDYRITPRNLEIVSKMIADGAAVIGTVAEADRANRLTPAPARVKGHATVKPKRA